MQTSTTTLLRLIYCGLFASAALAIAGCADPTGDESGLDMRSRGTGERDERLGNDPAEQNTGEGSTADEIDQANEPAQPAN
jgi:hypothetical protein